MTDEENGWPPEPVAEPWDEAVKWWGKPVADRVRGPMEIRDRSEMKIMVPKGDYRALLEEFVSTEYFDSESGDCIFCGEYQHWSQSLQRPTEVVHLEDCLWRRAKEALR